MGPVIGIGCRAALDEEVAADTAGDAKDECQECAHLLLSAGDPWLGSLNIYFNIFGCHRQKPVLL